MTIISKLQSALPKVGAAAKTLGGKPLGIASKVLGAATVVGVIYDAHINGREKAISTDEINTADRYFNQYNKYMTMDKPSATLSKLKKWWFNTEKNFGYYHIVDQTKGYTSQFIKTIGENLPLIGLSALALKCKNIGKVAGVLLAANGIKTILYDVMGIGTTKKQRHY